MTCAGVTCHSCGTSGSTALQPLHYWSSSRWRGQQWQQQRRRLPRLLLLLIGPTALRPR